MKGIRITATVFCCLSIAVGIVAGIDYGANDSFNFSQAFKVIMCQLSATFWLLVAAIAYVVEKANNVAK